MTDLEGRELPPLDSASSSMAYYLRAILLELQAQRFRRESISVPSVFGQRSGQQSAVFHDPEGKKKGAGKKP